MEVFANVATTTLNGGINAGVTSLVVADGTLFPATGNFRILIDSELILVGARSGATLSSLTRGIEGTSATTHSNGATVSHVLTAGACAGFAQGPGSSIDGEIALYDSTTGKLLKRASVTGLLKAASGVLAQAVAGTDYSAPGHAHAGSDITSGTIAPARLGSGSGGATKFLREDSTWQTVTGTGDVVGPASSVDGEIALYDSTTGKLLKRMTGSGLVKVASGVASIASGGTDYANASHAHAAADIASGTIATARLGSGTANNTTFLRGDQTWATPTGSGDVVGPASSVDSEIALFDSTTGKLLKRATGTGILRATSGVYGTPGNVVESEITLADNTTNDVSTTKHGFVPKAPNDTAKYLRGDGAWAVPPTTRAIPIVIDGGGSPIGTGIAGDLYIPFACTIIAVTLLADQSGSIVLDIWKDSYANYPPTVADTITASAKPTISAAVKSQDSTLTGWTTAIAAGDSLRWNVDSASTITRLTATLTVTVP